MLKYESDNWSICNFKYNQKILFSKKKINIKKIKKLNIFRPPQDEFWADPFVFKFKKKKYVFFEKFLKKKNKGIISVCILKNNKLINFKDILVKKYHLSYPFVFKHKNKIYLIPESYQSKKMEIYQFVVIS